MAFRIAQLSDLHLSGNFKKTNHSEQDPSIRQFLACLGLALSYQPNFLLLTGDLVNNGDKDGYAWLFDTLTQTKLPFVCLAGNHDVTLEIGHELPYEQRQFFPLDKDERLASHVHFDLPNHFQLICLNSAVSGKEFGRLSPESLAWLDDTLHTHQRPSIIALHHPPINIGSAWIDALRLQNGDELFAILQNHPHAHTVLTGHVHQAHTLHHAHVQILTAPAVSRQFLPFADEFALDDDPITGQAGFRLITLPDTAPFDTTPCDNLAYLNSQVIRLPNPSSCR